MRVPMSVKSWWHWNIEQWWVMSRFNLKSIRPGDIYSDCSYHPVLCIANDRGDLSGISLIDGTGPRCCSAFHCGPVKMSISEATSLKSVIDNCKHEHMRKITWMNFCDDCGYSEMVE